MIWSMFKQEFSRHKLIHSILLFFMTLSSMLLASAVFIVVVLFSGVNQLIEKADAPHFIQMHVGEVDQEVVDEFHQSVSYIKKYQQLEMISISGEQLFVKNDLESEVKSVMDVSFIRQNESFDFLLNQENEIAVIEDGMVGVPVYYQTRYDLELGDEITLKNGEETFVFTVSAFIRDSQMNPSLVSSKRFVISDGDYELLGEAFINREVVFEYQFDSTSRISEFHRLYSASMMPKSGPTVDVRLFKTLNALTDGLIVLILVVLSMTLMMIGLLSLRFTLLGTIEEDIKEIGVLRAIGFTTKKIRKLYVMKYAFLAMIACFVGYLGSLYINQLFLANIYAYLGRVDISAGMRLIPIFGAIAVFMLILFGVYRTLRKIKKWSIIEAIAHHGAVEKKRKRRKKRNGSLRKRSFVNLPMYMSVKALWTHKKSYRLMMFVLVSALLMMIIPSHVVTTMESEEFLSYLGVGKSDLRIDIRASQEMETMRTHVMDTLNQDDDVLELGLFNTYMVEAYNQDSEVENIPVEVGDISMLQLNYVSGEAPKAEGEIALSVLSLQSLDSSLHQYVKINTPEGIKEFYVTGVYQDITNGGKTAKAFVNMFGDDEIWVVVNVLFDDDVDASDKEAVYSDIFNGVKITSLNEYLYQTLGNTISQLSLIRNIAMVLGVAISMLITGLFLKLLLAKESKEIAIQSSIGFAKRDLMKQYVLRMMILLVISLIVGSLIIVLIGEDMVSVISGIFGASKLVFVVNPWTSYVLSIGTLMVAVFMTSLLTIWFYDMKKNHEYLVS